MKFNVAIFLAALAGVILGGCVAPTAKVTHPAITAPIHWDRLEVQVCYDSTIAPSYVEPLKAAVTDIDQACQCELFRAPVEGLPLFGGGVPGAPDRGTVYVRDDGNTRPGQGHTDPYTFPDGTLYSAEVVLPLKQAVTGFNPLFAGTYFDGPPVSPELQRVAALHEVGHAAGLPHNSNPASALYHVAREGQRLLADDVAELQRLYGHYTPRLTP